MNTTDRRNWLKTIALGGGFTLMGGVRGYASLIPDYSPPLAGPAKLNSNENPYGPSDSVRKVIQENFDSGCRYPFQYIKALVRDIAKKEEVSEDYAPAIVAESTKQLNVMSVADAVMSLDLTDEPLLIFKNAGNDALNVVYRRNDGNVGWIDAGDIKS